jgi:hypothetical protein
MRLGIFAHSTRQFAKHLGYAPGGFLQACPFGILPEAFEYQAHALCNQIEIYFASELVCFGFV